jgi:hypothetical protein
MAQVVSAESGPQGRANLSWNVLDQPSAEEGAPQNAAESVPAKLFEFGDEQKGETESLASKESVPSHEQQQQQSQEKPTQEKGTPEEGRSKEQSPKRLSNYEKHKRKRAALEARANALAQRETEFAQRERAQAEAQAKANEPPYTLKELKDYRKTWERDGNFDLVEKADAEISRLEALEADSRQTVEIPRSGTPAFVEQWQGAEKELYGLDPEFQREGTRLDKVLRSMMAGPDGAIYRQHPRGIIAAYHRARLDLAEADLSAARSEIAKLKAENARLNGHMSISGSGAAGRSVAELGERDFASMSTAQMREHLKRRAAQNNRW